MPSRNELNARARVVGLTPANYANDSKLEQAILWREKRATAATGSVATTDLTSDATNPAADGFITIGPVVYQVKSALTERYATTKLTCTDQPHDGDTLTIDNITYTFLDVIGGAYTILIGASLAATLDQCIMCS